MPAEVVPVEKSPFEFNAEYDEDFDAPIGEQVEVAAAKESPAEPVVTDKPNPSAAGKEAPRHNAMSLHFAKELGMGAAEIAELSPKELDAAVKLAHKAHLKASQEFSRNRPKEEPEPAEPEPKEEEDEFAEFADEVAPQVLAAIKKSRAADKKRLDELGAKLAEYEGEKKAALAAKFYDAVDEQFAQMPAAVKAIIGDGGRDKVSRVQKAVRKQILELANGDETEGASWSEKLDRATRFLVGDEAFTSPAEADESIAEGYGAKATAPEKKPVPPKTPDGKFASKTVAEREAAWKGSGTAPPTQRDPTPQKGESLALKTAHKFMLENKMLDPDDLTLDSFPK